MTQVFPSENAKAQIEEKYLKKTETTKVIPQSSLFQYEPRHNQRHLHNSGECDCTPLNGYYPVRNEMGNVVKTPGIIKNRFPCFATETYVVGTKKNSLKTDI